MTVWSRLATMVLGVLLIAVIAPLSQFLTIMTVNADVETATPVGWAVGIVFGLVLALAVVRLVAKTRRLERPNLVLLYTMLTIAVPMMNLGLVRPYFLTMTGVVQEYMNLGTSTYRTVYNARDPQWFPIVPTVEGLAWNKTDRLIRTLSNTRLTAPRAAARDALDRAIRAEARRLERAKLADPPAGELSPQLKASVEALGADEARALLKLAASADRGEWHAAAMKSLGVSLPELEAIVVRGAAASQAALKRLEAVLPYFDEHEVSQLDEFVRVLDISAQKRVQVERSRLPLQESEELDRRLKVLTTPLQTLVGDAAAAPAMRPEVAQALTSLYAELLPAAGALPLHQVFTRDLAALRAEEMGALRSRLTQGYDAAFAAMSVAEVDRLRHNMVYRMSREERKRMIAQNGNEGTPNQNFEGIMESLWPNQSSQLAKQRYTVRENLQTVWRDLPWQIWLPPMVRWAGLFLAVFLFLMVLSEWLRRKWIERENLAFPLVDVADYLLRHDAALETAEDIRHPQQRKTPFSGIFLAGMALGLVMLSLEAGSHYQVLHLGSPVVTYDLSAKVFTSGAVKSMDGVLLVLSPIILGLAFLVSLEISLSVWVIFVIYKVLVLLGKLGGGSEIRDTIYSGYAGGRFFPFPMEQMLGACLCFTGVILFKSWRTRAPKGQVAGDSHYIHPALNAAGMVGLPVAILGLLWWMGVRDVVLLAVFVTVAMSQAIAAARVRAETGLPTHHVSYEFSKLPMILGLTGMSGSKVFSVFISVAFLPVTLLLRALPQQLENMELARRHQVRYGTVAWASLLAFITALGVGMFSFILFAHYLGGDFFGVNVFAGQGTGPNYGLATYPLFVSHFQGEAGLDKFTVVQWHRVGFMAIGFGAFGLLTFLRGRFLRFPLHPLGYMLVLLSIYYEWVSPYIRGEGGAGKENSWLWGSFLVAWLIKFLIVKYGGMNAYKRAKPFFLGMVVGAVLAIFLWNMTDLAFSLVGEYADPANLSEGMKQAVKLFHDRQPYSPKWY